VGMALQAESFRPFSEFFVHYVNDFRYRKEFFMQHVHVLVEVNYENLGRTADESFSTEKLENLARYPPTSGSIMSYEEVVQDPVRNAPSSYPSHHVICSSSYQLRRGETVGVFTQSIGSRIDFDLLRCCFSLLVGQSLIRFRKILLGRSPIDLQLGLQLHFYDLQSSERDKRGNKRRWLIAWTLARDAVASRQEEERKIPTDCVLTLNAAKGSLGLPRCRSQGRKFGYVLIAVLRQLRWHPMLVPSAMAVANVVRLLISNKSLDYFRKSRETGVKSESKFNVSEGTHCFVSFMRYPRSFFSWILTSTSKYRARRNLRNLNLRSSS